MGGVLYSRYWAGWLLAIWSAAFCAGLALSWVDPGRYYSLPFGQSIGISLVGAGLTSLTAALSVRVIRNPSRGGVLLILAVAFGARCVIATSLSGAPLGYGGDTEAYRSIALSIAHGQGIVLHGVKNLFAIYPPAYPIALAVPLALGLPMRASIYALNVLADLIAAAAIRKIAARLGMGARADVAGALYFLLPPVICSFSIAGKEPLAMAVIAQLFLGFVGLGERRARASAVHIGLAAGLLALTQPAWVAIVAPLGLYSLWAVGWRKTLAAGTGATAIAAVVILPWVVRNYSLFGALVPLTSGAGTNLYFVVTNSYARATQALLAPGLNEVEASSRAGRQAVAWIASHPRPYVIGQFKSVAYAVSLCGFRAALYLFDGGSALIAAVMARTSQMSGALLAAGASWASFRRSIPRPLLALFLAGLLHVALFEFWFEVGERHITYLFTLVLLMAVAGLTPRSGHFDGTSLVKPKTGGCSE